MYSIFVFQILNVFSWKWFFSTVDMITQNVFNILEWFFFNSSKCQTIFFKFVNNKNFIIWRLKFLFKIKSHLGKKNPADSKEAPFWEASNQKQIQANNYYFL